MVNFKVLTLELRAGEEEVEVGTAFCADLQKGRSHCVMRHKLCYPRARLGPANFRYPRAVNGHDLARLVEHPVLRVKGAPLGVEILEAMLLGTTKISIIVFDTANGCVRPLNAHFGRRGHRRDDLVQRLH